MSLGETMALSEAMREVADKLDSTVEPYSNETHAKVFRQFAEAAERVEWVVGELLDVINATGRAIAETKGRGAKDTRDLDEARSHIISFHMDMYNLSKRSRRHGLVKA